jgi:transposase
MAKGSRVELFERIRRDRREEALSIRELARRHRVHRRTVRQALASAVPPQRRTPERVSPVLGPYREVIRGWLRTDEQLPRKQRHTAHRVWQRLVDEYGAQVGESTVRAFVAQVKAERRTGVAVVTVPQTHPPGQEAEVDFGEIRSWVAGTSEKLWLFVLRLSCSGKAVHVAYANTAQESFLDGFVIAFDRLGGVPARVRLDNLKPAVIRVLLGRERLENPRFVALRSHYGFDAFYCQPGIEGAHEKGGVEGEIGRFRRRHLVPIPTVDSLGELNGLLAEADAADDARRIGSRRHTVGEAFAVEAATLRPLQEQPFDPAQRLVCRVDSKARVCVRQSYYSVPARLAGLRVSVRLGARRVQILDGGRVVAEHPRSLHKYTEDLVLDHYLEVLERKPGALPGATALAQARASGGFTDVHDRFWAAARRAVGDRHGTSALIGVLLLHRTLPGDAVTAGLLEAISVGRFDPDLVAVMARRHLDQARAKLVSQPDTELAAALQRVTPIGVTRPAPGLDGYDQLLAGAAGGAMR